MDVLIGFALIVLAARYAAGPSPAPTGKKWAIPVGRPRR